MAADPWAAFKDAPQDDPWATFADAQPQPQPQQQGGTGGFRASRTGRFLQGMADPIIGAAQGAAHLPSPWAFLIPGMAEQKGRIASGVDAAVQSNERAYQESRGPDAGVDWWRLGGNFASPANIVGGAATLPARGAGLGARVVSGAGAGTVSAGMMPVTEGDYATEKASQFGAGALAGGAIPIAGSALRGVLAPAMAKGAQALSREGVPVTTGRMLGRAGAAVEDKMRSWPVVGGAISGAQRRSVDALNRAAVNRSLAHIKQSLPDSIGTGHEAIAYTDDVIGAGYDYVLSRMASRPDQRFINDISNIGRTIVAKLPEAQREQFKAIMQAEIGKFGNFGKFGAHLRALGGEELKGIQRQLRADADGLRRSAEYNTQQLGYAVGKARDAFMDLVARTNPKDAGNLKALDRAFASFARVRDAAGSAASVDGVFSPATLHQAVRRGDRSSGRREFARGRAVLQDLSNAAKDVLPSAVPNSGTADRLLLPLLAGGALGYSETGLPGNQYALPAAALLGGGAAAYSPAGQALINALLFKRPDLVRRMGSAAGRNAPLLSAPAGAIALPSQNY